MNNLKRLPTLTVQQEFDRLQALIAPIVASVHGVVPKALADNYIAVSDELERRQAQS